jgi:hypothetical protein
MFGKCKTIQAVENHHAFLLPIHTSKIDCHFLYSFNRTLGLRIVIAAFRWFWPHVLCMLIVCRPESCCMCVYNTHARSSADSFAVGSGVWSVFVMFSMAYFGTQSRILFPAKRYFWGLNAKYFSREIFCIYTVSHFVDKLTDFVGPGHICWNFSSHQNLWLIDTMRYWNHVTNGRARVTRFSIISTQFILLQHGHLWIGSGVGKARQFSGVSAKCPRFSFDF